MKLHPAWLLASAIVASPAAAKDAVQLPVEPVLDAGSYDGGWSGEWVDPETYQGRWEGAYHARPETPGDGRWGDAAPQDGPPPGWRPDGPPPHDLLGDPGFTGHERPMGYTPAQRAAWLDQCHAVYARPAVYHEGRRGHGGLIGGLIGALVGGVAGNRIADGERLGGTLIGAGVGGIAGAVIGSAIDSSGNREEHYYDEEPVADDCDAYLLRYEQSFRGPGYGQAPGYGPVRWVRVPVRRERVADERVIDERIVEQPEMISEPVVQPTKLLELK